MEWGIHGETTPGFEKVREAFKANWQGYEVGASCSVVYKGKKVVDLWGGYQDRCEILNLPERDKASHKIEL
jgi:hypothetical protein